MYFTRPAELPQSGDTCPNVYKQRPQKEHGDPAKELAGAGTLCLGLFFYIGLQRQVAHTAPEDGPVD